MYYFSKALDNDRMLCLAPMTDRMLQQSGQEIDDVSGYFLFASRRSDEFASVEIIARATSEDAAFALKELFGME
ncbi:MAG: hypothetical protein IV086_01805 [Hyphomonadaceae bacterium]|nr:hypothetical protein [Hyphomonadaceae bacterium]